MDPCMQISEVLLKVCRISLPRQPVHPGGGVALEHEERLPEQIDAEVVEERGVPFSFAELPSVRERAPGSHEPDPVSGVCFARLRSSWSPPLAPPAPPPVARHRSSASRLLWRSQTSHGRASSASAPRLPDADQSSARYGRCWPAVGPPGSRTRSFCTCQGL